MTWIIIALALFLAISAFRLKLALYLIALLLPTYLIRFELFSIPFTFLEGMIIIAAGSWLAQLVIQRNWRSVRLPWRWLILFFLLTATVAIFVSPDTRAALGLWKAYFIEPVILYYMIANALQSNVERRWLVYVLGLSVVGVGLYALGQYLGWFHSPEPWISEFPKRVSSFFDYPNAVGLFVTPIIGMFLGFLTLKKHRYNPWFSGLVIAIGLAALFFSFTRGAALGVAAALIFLGLFSQRRKWVWLVLLITVIASLLIPTTRDQIQSIVNVTDVSTDVRVVLWEGTWNLLKANPIFGAGLAGFPELYDQYRLIKHTELLLYPHNIFLNFWTELGLAGLLAFLLLIISFYATGFQNKKHGRGSVLSLSLLSAMTALIVYGLVEAPYFKNDLSALFWILFALMASAKLAEQRASSSLVHDDIQRLKRHTIK